MKKCLTLTLFKWRGNRTQNLMGQYSFDEWLVLLFGFILLFGLLLRAEKDKRMRLYDGQSSFYEEMPHPNPLLVEREQRTSLMKYYSLVNLLAR